MYTFETKKTTIHYNSDMSGNCHIINSETGEVVEVPCEDILDFVASYVRMQKIGKLEQMDTKELLRI